MLARGSAPWQTGRTVEWCDSDMYGGCGSRRLPEGEGVIGTCEHVDVTPDPQKRQNCTWVLASTRKIDSWPNSILYWAMTSLTEALLSAFPGCTSNSSFICSRPSF